MAYSDDDKAVHDGEPVYIFRFTSQLGVYRYTSSTEDYAHTDGFTYTATPMAMSDYQETDSGDGGELTVSILASLPLPLAYSFIPPQGDLQLEVFKAHSHTPANFRQLWNGLITGMSYSGGMCEFKSVSLMQLLVKRKFPRKVFQALCGHTLGDAFCTVDTDALKVTTTVDAVGGTAITTFDDGLKADGYFDAGEIIRVSDGERRMVYQHTGNDFVIDYPFREMDLGDSVELIPGCLRSNTVCLDKFDNVLNFGGHPNIPSVDYFRHSLRGIS